MIHVFSLLMVSLGAISAAFFQDRTRKLQGGDTNLTRKEVFIMIAPMLVLIGICFIAHSWRFPTSLPSSWSPFVDGFLITSGVGSILFSYLRMKKAEAKIAPNNSSK